jgi:hypothetical protein
MLGRKLLELGLVTEEQVLEALEAQESRAPSLPRLAVELDAMNHETALALLDLRAAGDERPFEVIAQEHLWLTREDIDQLHAERARRRPRLGDILVRLGHLSRDDLERTLRGLRKAS